MSLSKIYNGPGKFHVNSELSGEQNPSSANLNVSVHGTRLIEIHRNCHVPVLIAFRQDVQYLSQLGSVPADESAADTRHQ